LSVVKICPYKDFFLAWQTLYDGKILKYLFRIPDIVFNNGSHIRINIFQEEEEWAYE